MMSSNADLFMMSGDHARFRGVVFAKEVESVAARDLMLGHPCGAAWSPVRLRWFQGEAKAPVLPKGDYAGLYVKLPVWNLRAQDALSALTEGHVEVLPVQCEGERLFLQNVLDVCEHALDEEKADLRRYPSTGRVSMVKRWVIRRSAVPGPIFRVAQAPTLAVFVTREFVQRVRDCGLTGFRFEPVEIT